ncbi:MAG: Lrp/AsnC family transcriptional regulator [Terasakiella sp.]|uniref:Lrp/AsnC family transcriptional regulator n=1 Tax=unclassified Terasakiella TaxID=2614952 RepID=UPI003B0035E3
MDAKDVQIIRVLQENGRLSNQELSEKVNLSPSPCLRRLRLLEKQGVIKGYTALVDQKAYGLPLTVFIQVRLERHNTEAVRTFEHRVKMIPEIMDCYITTGGSDYLLRVVCQNLDAYEFFVRETLHNVPGIASIDTSFAYSVVKQGHVFPGISQT